MAYAVLRFEKIKSSPDLTAMAGHWDRTRPTPNADPNAQDWAVQFLHGQDGVSEVEKRLPAKRRKDAVICVEALLTASAEYFRPEDPSKAGVYDDERTRAWVKAAMKWLKSEFGDRLASAVVHLDEATPHIHGAIVPLDKSTGRLNAKEQFGRGPLRRFQTTYGKALKHLGIERGQEYSQARHEDVQRYYGIVNAALEPPDLTLGDKAALAIGKTPDTIKALQAQAADGRKARDEANKAKAEARRQAEARSRAEAAAAEAKAAERATAGRLRQIPLTTVLPLLGYGRRQKGQDVEWTGPMGPLATGAAEGKPSKFFLHDTGSSGRGAIDLVKAVNGADDAGALAWLARFIEGRDLVADAAAQAEAEAKEAVAAALAKPTPVLNLSHDPDDLAQVLKRLEANGLEAGKAASLHQLGLVGAARFGQRLHLAYPLFQGQRSSRDEEPIGYIVEDLGQEKSRPRRYGAPGLWHFSYRTGYENAERVVHVLTQHPSDAMALSSLALEQRGVLPQLEDGRIQRTVYVAAGHSSPDHFRSAVARAKQDGASLILAFRDDDKGRGFTQVASQEAKKQAVPTSNAAGVLTLASVGDFTQLWLTILHDGWEWLLEHLKAARLKRQKEIEAAQRDKGHGRG